MATYYQATIQFQQQDEKGYMKTQTHIYLFDATSYTEAETRAYEYCAEELKEFKVAKITKMNFNEVFFIENAAETWFKVKTNYIVFDEKNQKEKKVPFYFLINANDIKETFALISEKLGSVQDYVIDSIQSTQILDIIPYIEEDLLFKEN